LIGASVEETPKSPLFNPFNSKLPVPKAGEVGLDMEKLLVFKPKNKRFLSLDDLTHLPEPMWCIEGMFEANSLIMLAGPPASYKSFLALSWLLAMASGKEWCGRKTQPAKVLYVLGEGKSSLLKGAKRGSTGSSWREMNESV